jgi:hypothetical protein
MWDRLLDRVRCWHTKCHSRGCRHRKRLEICKRESPTEARAGWRLKTGRAGGGKCCRTPLVKSIWPAAQRCGPQNSRSGQGGQTHKLRAGRVCDTYGITVPKEGWPSPACSREARARSRSRTDENPRWRCSRSKIFLSRNYRGRGFLGKRGARHAFVRRLMFEFFISRLIQSSDIADVFRSVPRDGKQIQFH